MELYSELSITLKHTYHDELYLLYNYETQTTSMSQNQLERQTGLRLLPTQAEGHVLKFPLNARMSSVLLSCKARI